jgi:hypothetical protein
MAHAATKEDAASPTGSTAADRMIRLLYLEIVRKDDYVQAMEKGPVAVSAAAGFDEHD